jgi:hypothetical protein
MSRCLLIVQGINSNGKYLLEDFEDFPSLKKKYDAIINAPVEKAWDHTWVSKLPVIGDKFGDIWNFYKNEQARIKACKLTSERIIEAKKEFKQVDILCHSLGTVVTLCSGPEHSTRRPPIEIDNLYFLQSPLGLGIPFLDNIALSHAERYSTNFVAAKIYNLYSSIDIVSKKLHHRNKRALNILQRCSKNNVVTFNLKCPHDSFECLEHIWKRGLWV